MPSREELIEAMAQMLAGIGQPDDTPARRQAYFERWAGKVLDAILDRLKPDPEMSERDCTYGPRPIIVQSDVWEWSDYAGNYLNLRPVANGDLDVTGSRASPVGGLGEMARFRVAKPDVPGFLSSLVGWVADQLAVVERSAGTLARREAVDLTEEEIRTAVRQSLADGWRRTLDERTELITAAILALQQRLSEMGS